MVWHVVLYGELSTLHVVLPVSESDATIEATVGERGKVYQPWRAERIHCLARGSAPFPGADGVNRFVVELTGTEPAMVQTLLKLGSPVEQFTLDPGEGAGSL
jgi:hypothetical protein